MIIGGLQKTTLIDYPGKIACAIFVVGCNFRCPFCHNKDLVTAALFKKSKNKPIAEKDFFDFLKKRKSILDGVCITGGEPAINPDLPEFIKKIKQLGYSVKLDTNGSNPEMLKRLISKNLVDYIAMDLKGSFDEYEKFTGVKVSKMSILRSMDILVQSKLPYEFRTTIVPGLHNKENLTKLALQLKSLITHYPLSITHFNWFLQKFQPQNCLDPEFLKVRPYSNKQMNKFLLAVKKTLPYPNSRFNLSLRFKLRI